MTNTVTPLLALTKVGQREVQDPRGLAHVLGLDLDILDQSVTLTGVQTLTNKTLTSPVLTSPSVLTGDLTITVGRLVFGAAASKIVPGATSLALRNHGDTDDNLFLSDAGVLTARAGLRSTTGNLQLLADNAYLSLRSGATETWRIGDGVGVASGILSFYGLVGGASRMSLSAAGALVVTTSVTAPTFTGHLVGNADTATFATTSGGAGPTGSASGDLTGTYPGPTLAAIGAATGPTGSATVVPVVTIDAKGRVTALTSATLVAPAGTLTGATLAATVLASSLTSVGILAAPHMTSPVVDSGGLTLTAGNLAFSATGQRITGDFSNATVANRVGFQSSTVNGTTAVPAIPNGTGTTASFSAYNAADPDNAGSVGLTNNNTVARLVTGKIGTGTEPATLEIRTAAGAFLSLATATRVATLSGALITLASATGGAGLNLPHGAAPTSPVNGDIWSTTAGLFIRINGVTKTVTLT